MKKFIEKDDRYLPRQLITKTKFYYKLEESSEGSSDLECEILDISSIGLSFKVFDKSLIPKGNIRVKVIFPDDLEIEAMAQVKRVEENIVGVSFTSISDEAEDIILSEAFAFDLEKIKEIQE